MTRNYSIRETTPQDTEGRTRFYTSDEAVKRDYPWLAPALRVLPVGAKVLVQGDEFSITAEVVKG